MPACEIEFQRKRLFIERLYKELQTVQEFRFKFTITKITFVIGLLGIGSMTLSKAGNNIDLTPALLLSPLVAVLFDILGMTATVAIYRIDAFLRIKGERDEKEWQDFLKRNPLSVCKEYPRWSFYRCAADGFTAITFVASAIALYAKSSIHSEIPHWLRLHPIVPVLWFVVVALIWVGFRCWEGKLKSGLKKKKK